MYTTTEAANILRIAPRTLYRYVKEGKLKPITVGRRWLFNETELIKFLRHGTPKKARNTEVKNTEQATGEAKETITEEASQPLQAEKNPTSVN